MLHDYLNSQAQAGRRHSEGSFTIKAEDARRKLSQAGLESAEDSLFRLVQLGIDSNAGETDITIGSDSVTIWFRHVRRGVLYSEVLSEELQTTLLACLHNGFPEAVYSNRKASWEIAADTFRPVQPTKILPDHARILLHRIPDGGFWERLRYNLSSRAQTFRTLETKLRFAPLKVIVDSRVPVPSLAMSPQVLELDILGPSCLKPWSVKAPTVSKRTYLDYSLGSRVLCPSLGVRRKWTCHIKFRTQATAEFFAPNLLGWMHRDPVHSALLGRIWVAPSTKNDGRFRFVRSGVEIGEKSWPFSGCVSGIVSAVGLPTDLSGLSLNEGPALERFFRYLLSEIREATQEIERLHSRDEMVTAYLKPMEANT